MQFESFTDMGFSSDVGASKEGIIDFMSKSQIRKFSDVNINQALAVARRLNEFYESGFEKSNQSRHRHEHSKADDVLVLKALKKIKPLYILLLYTIKLIRFCIQGARNHKKIYLNAKNLRYKKISQPEVKKLTVACILDDVALLNFKEEFQSIILNVKSWKNQLQSKNPDFIFFSTSQESNFNDFFKPKNREVLEDLVIFCKQNKIPQILWDKEDFSDFGGFLELAKSVDFVFASDLRCVELYSQNLHRKEIYHLPFAVQNRVHNPTVKALKPIPKLACKAPSLETSKSENLMQFEDWATPLFNVGAIDIYKLNNAEIVNSNLFENSKDTRSINKMLATFKKYTAFLSHGSEQEGATFQRKAIEILACATPVIYSSHSFLSRYLNGNECLVANSREAYEMGLRLILDQDYQNRMGHIASRKILSEHTYSHRVREMAEKIGLKDRIEVQSDLVSVICVSNRPSYIDCVLENFRSQIYPSLEFIFVMNSDDFIESEVNEKFEELKNIKILRKPPEATLGECLNEARAHVNGKFFAKFDDDDEYGSHYIMDTILAFNFSGADIVGKKAYYAYVKGMDCTVLRFPDQEYRYSHIVSGASLVVKTEHTKDIQFAKVPKGTDTNFLNSCRDRGLRIFASDRFNFLVNRSASKDQHTWKIDDQEFISSSKIVSDGKRKDLIFF
ncbi:MAG: glycosyltransferase [Oligoflexales bacterium]|nr:glycosyltransferase [Oligoflexales bacterium]